MAGSEAISLSELEAQRSRNAVLLVARCPDTSEDAVLRFNENVPVGNHCYFDPHCCWIVGMDGFKRFYIGDTSHGQSHRRFVHSLSSISKPSLFEHEQLKPWKFTLISNREEGPLVTASCREIDSFHIIQQVEEQSVDISNLKSGVARFGVQMSEVLLLMAISGCTECPPTRRVRQTTYVRAFVRFKRHYDHLLSEQSNIVYHMSEDYNITETFWLPMEILLSIAYFLGRERANDLPSNMLSLLIEIPKERPHVIRRHVAANLMSEVCSTLLMPERSDFKLQFRQALSTLRYCLSAIDRNCSGDMLPLAA